MSRKYRVRDTKSEWYKLKNGRWLKVFYKKHTDKFGTLIWNVAIVVAKSKRQCNDSIYKTNISPKKLYGKSTAGNDGVEALVISLGSLLRFEKTMKKGTEIHLFSFDEKRFSAYRRLLKYGYFVAENKEAESEKERIFYKKIIE